MHQSCWCWVKSWWLTCACVCVYPDVYLPGNQSEPALSTLSHPNISFIWSRRVQFVKKRKTGTWATVSVFGRESCRDESVVVGGWWQKRRASEAWRREDGVARWGRGEEEVCWRRRKESRDIMFPQILLFIFLWSTKWVRDERQRGWRDRERERIR